LRDGDLGSTHGFDAVYGRCSTGGEGGLVFAGTEVFGRCQDAASCGGSIGDVAVFDRFYRDCAGPAQFPAAVAVLGEYVVVIEHEELGNKRR